MEDFIDRRYPDLPDRKERSFDELRIIVREAKDSVTTESFVKIVENMPRIC